MIKRMNKVTSLLVAAAAVLSLVPATGVDAAVRLGNKSGTIKEGIAFDGGKYSYYGYKSDTAETGVYFNNGTDASETLNSDLEDYRLNTLSKYGTKYAYAYEQSNDDEYLVDLSTGKIIDDATKEEKEALAKTNLVAKIKKANRYNSGVVSSFDQILQGQFGEVWYKYAADGTETSQVSDASTVDAAPAKIIVPILSQADFTAKANASTVATGFTGTVAGKTFTYVANGSKASQITAQQVAISNDGATTPSPVNPSGTSVAVAAGAFTFTGYPVAGTFKTTLDGIVQSYDAYLKAKVSAGILVAGSTTPVATASNGTIYEFKAGATASQQALVQADILGFEEKINNAISDASTQYANVGTDLITGYSDYVTFATNVVNAQLTAANATSAGFSATIAAIQPTDSKIELIAAVDGPVDSATSKQALVNVFGSAFVDGNVAGQKPAQYVNNKFYGFSDENGKYIDASYTANVKVYSKTKGRAVNVDQFGKEVKDAGLKVDLVSIDAIAQDKDFIYTITKVKVTGSVSEDQTFIQKISKAQGDKTNDGAYTPKSVQSFQLSNGIYDNDDATNAAALFNSTNQDYKYLLGISVKDGNTIYVTRANEDEVKVYKVTLDNSVKADVLASGATLKTDVDSALALSSDDDNEKEDITSFGISNSSDDEGLQGITAIKVSNETNADEVQLNGETLYKHPSVSIDTNGNTWALKKGKVTKFDGITKKSDIYTVDGAMNALDVYDDGNMIAWDVDGDIYTNVQEGKAQTGTEAGNVTPSQPAPQTKTGWDKQADGTWKLFGTDGKELAGWQKDGATWYYLDPATKVMKTGWLNDNGTWYYLKSSGAMQTGWVNDNGTWYYLNGSGAMKTGWVNDNGTWYYLNASGAMLANTVVDGYKLGASGAWVK